MAQEWPLLHVTNLTSFLSACAHAVLLESRPESTFERLEQEPFRIGKSLPRHLGNVSSLLCRLQSIPEQGAKTESCEELVLSSSLSHHSGQRETLYGSTKFNFVAETLKAQSPNWWTILSKTEGWSPLLEGCAPSRCAVLHPHASQSRVKISVSMGCKRLLGATSREAH